MYTDTDMTIEEKHDMYLNQYKTITNDLKYIGIIFIVSFCCFLLCMFCGFVKLGIFCIIITCVMWFSNFYFILKKSKARNKQLELNTLYFTNIGGSDEEYW